MISAIVGGNWGDEGKGKMTDLLAGQSDIVVRFQGGANAGHTIVNPYGKFVLHTLPSGVFHEHVTNVISSGAALDLDSLFGELDMLAGKNIYPNLLISERTQIVMFYHILFDQLEEKRLGNAGFGSTRSGIAPFYSDKYLKIGYQVADLYEADFTDRLCAVCRVKQQQLQTIYGYDKSLDASAVADRVLSYRERLAPYLGNASHFLQQSQEQDKNILLEGQLGALRDPDNGIYPFVTSSSPLAGYASVSTGLPPHAIQRIITVIKAYSSCVGAGAFVSEIFGEEATQLRNLGGDGGEYGATTGRPRRMGWMDTIASRYGCTLQGTTEVALSLLDVLGYLEKIPVCIAYEVDGQRTDTFPTTAKLNRAKPVYTYLDGWQCSIRGIRKYADLPIQAKQYVMFLEKQLGYPIKMISNGPRREDIILR